jgi:hypothetical protein
VLTRLRARETATSLLEVTGFAAISTGIGLMSLPFGIIAAGCSCVLIGWLAG